MSNNWLAFVLVFVTTACATVKVKEPVSLASAYITYSKVKAKVRLPQGNEYSCKGYIAITRDSLICFRFFGPLSYEVVNGRIDRDFKVYDCINKRLFDNGFDLVKEKIGLSMNRLAWEDLLLTNFSGLKERLLQLNTLNLQIDSTTKQKRLMIDDNRFQCKITASLSGQLPKKIVIESKDNVGKYTIELDFLLISNDKRKCNFTY